MITPRINVLVGHIDGQIKIMIIDPTRPIAIQLHQDWIWCKWSCWITGSWQIVFNAKYVNRIIHGGRMENIQNSFIHPN